MKHRNAGLTIATIGVVASWFLPLLIRSIHDAHGMSVAAEFRIYHLFDPDRIAEMQDRYPEEGYSVDQRVRSVGALHVYMPILSAILSSLFVALGYICYNATPVGWPRERPSDESMHGG